MVAVVGLSYYGYRQSTVVVEEFRVWQKKIVPSAAGEAFRNKRKINAINISKLG